MTAKQKGKCIYQNNSSPKSDEKSDEKSDGLYNCKCQDTYTTYESRVYKLS